VLSVLWTLREVVVHYSCGLRRGTLGHASGIVEREREVDVLERSNILGWVIHNSQNSIRRSRGRWVLKHSLIL
jgi:hypothetical protein